MRQAVSLAALLLHKAARRAVGTASAAAPSVTHARVKLCLLIVLSRQATASHSNRKLETAPLPATGRGIASNRCYPMGCYTVHTG